MILEFQLLLFFPFSFPPLFFFSCPDLFSLNSPILLFTQSPLFISQSVDAKQNSSLLSLALSELVIFSKKLLLADLACSVTLLLLEERGGGLRRKRFTEASIWQKEMLLRLQSDECLEWLWEGELSFLYRLRMKVWLGYVRSARGDSIELVVAGDRLILLFVWVFIS